MVYATVPDFAVPMLAIERGYHNSNPYMFYSFLIYVFLKNLRISFLRTPTMDPTIPFEPQVVNHHHGFVNNMRYLMNLLADFQMILKADEKKLNQLSFDQLLRLREEFSQKIAEIEYLISNKKDILLKKNNNEFADKEKCMICDSETAIIHQSPCCHTLMC